MNTKCATMDIREHPLGRRWTDPKHAVLPDDVLDQMVPFTPEEAEEICERFRAAEGRTGLSPEEYEMRVIPSGILSPAEGCAWLRFQQPDTEAEVFLSWEPDTAIQTTWGVFADHWEDFCHLASGDLNVWPENGNWALFFHHDETFQFGRRKRM